MPGTNLTREEAFERSATISVETYQIELDLSIDSATRFGSTTTIAFTAKPGASTFADLVGAEIFSITLNGEPVDISAYQDSRIQLANLQERNELRVEATCAYSNTGEGMHRFVDPADDKVYLYTQFEVPDARRVFTTFEQPDLKARFTFKVTAPSDWTVVSNTAPESTGPGQAGTATWHFAQTEVMSTYITAIVAGPYVGVHETYTGSYGDVPLGIYCRESLLADLDADAIFEITKQGFYYFEGVFEMGYPFGKYDQLFVPEYNMGAMENAGCVTFRDDYIFRSRQTTAAYEARSNTILHEMAHMWFGDLVTMKWWDDLWLNESFAEYASHQANVDATKFVNAWTTFANQRKNWAYRQDQLPSTHPISADNYDLHAVEANFDGITYAKGASALKQLVAWVGRDDFFAGLRSYFGKHAFGNTELTDLFTELEAASGRDLGPWAAEWLQTAGVNTLRPVFDIAPDGTFSSFAVEQTAIAEFPTLRRHRVAIGLYNLQGGALVRTDRVETDIAGALTEISDLVGQQQPDLVLVNDDDLTYAKIRLDQRSFQTLTQNISAITDSLPRALCWSAAWDMTRDAELSGSDFITLVLAGVATESDQTAVESLLNQGLGAVNLYTAPDEYDDVRQRWEQGLNALMDAAEPGSDHQLSFVRAYTAAATSPQRVQELLDGSLPGLAVDADLRWQLIRNLSRLEAFDEEQIAAELTRDQTIVGKENAAAARAIRPTAEAKAEAWRRVVQDSSTPNETRRSIAGAFQVRGQADVLEPYVAQYLQMAETIIGEMGVWIGQVALILLFPKANPSVETLATVDKWLATANADPSAKRYVAEGRDDLARSLRAQRLI